MSVIGDIACTKAYPELRYAALKSVQRVDVKISRSEIFTYLRRFISECLLCQDPALCAIKGHKAAFSGI
jgi:hypothetical protein